MGVRVQRVATALVNYEIDKLLKLALTRKPKGITSLGIVRRYGLDDLGSYEYGDDHPPVGKARQCVRNAMHTAFERGRLGRLVHIIDFEEGRTTEYVRDWDGGILHVDPAKQYPAHRTVTSE